MVVKKAEWWLRLTTPDQCGQNPDNIVRGQQTQFLSFQFGFSGIKYNRKTHPMIYSMFDNWGEPKQAPH